MTAKRFIWAPGKSWCCFWRSWSESLVLLNSTEEQRAGEEAWHARKVPRQTKHSSFPLQEEGRAREAGGGHVTLSFQGRVKLNHADSNHRMGGRNDPREHDVSDGSGQTGTGREQGIRTSHFDPERGTCSCRLLLTFAPSYGWKMTQNKAI